MKCIYEKIRTQDKKEATHFYIKTRKGFADGIFAENKIWVHLITGQGCMKGIMHILINKFKVNKIIFTPLITNNIKNVVKGQIKICKADSPQNPYKEDFEYMECDWKD